jgi:hypothetical protein
MIYTVHALLFMFTFDKACKSADERLATRPLSEFGCQKGGGMGEL